MLRALGVGRTLLVHLCLVCAFGRAVTSAFGMLGVVVLEGVVFGAAEVFGDFGVDVISIRVGFVGND